VDKSISSDLLPMLDEICPHGIFNTARRSAPFH
jgi:hypothetical protein